MTVRLRALAAVLPAVLALGGCGIGDADPDRSHGPQTSSAPAPPVPGVVAVAGVGRALARRRRAQAAGGDTRLDLDVARTGEAVGFRRLCAGEADVVHSTRPIGADELARCGAHGLDVVQLQLAAEAVVLAVGATADVGVDCLALDDVRSAFAAGSGVLTWSQLGGSELPFVTAGPGPSSRTHRLLVAALGVDALRDDLRTGTRPDTRSFVAGFEPDRNLVARLPLLRAAVRRAEGTGQGGLVRLGPGHDPGRTGPGAWTPSSGSGSTCARSSGGTARRAPHDAGSTPSPAGSACSPPTEAAAHADALRVLAVDATGPGTGAGCIVPTDRDHRRRRLPARPPPAPHRDDPRLAPARGAGLPRRGRRPRRPAGRSFGHRARRRRPAPPPAVLARPLRPSRLRGPVRHGRRCRRPGPRPDPGRPGPLT